MINRPINSALPRQQVSNYEKFEKDKDSNGNTKWMKDTLDALEGIGRYVFYNSIELRKNYEIMSGRFNIEDYADVFDTYDMSSAIYEQLKLPSFLKHYDITTKAVRLLQGDFINRPDIFHVLATDSDTTNEKLRVKTDLMHMYMEEEARKEITKKLLAQGIDPNKSDFNTEEEATKYKEEIEKKYQELTPASIEKYMRYDYRTTAEQWGQAILINSIQRFNLREQDVLEFYDKCVVDRCFTHFYLTPDGFNVEIWNPLNTFYQYSPDLRYLEEGNYIGRIMYLSKPQVIDLFGWKMNLNQIEGLYPEYQKEQKQGSVYSEFFNATLYPFPDAREYDTLTTAIGQGLGYNGTEGGPYGFPIFGFYPSTDGTNYLFTQSDLVQVTQVYWKSQRKIGKLNLLNPETGEAETHIVDENFDPKLLGVEVVDDSYRDSNAPNTIAWTWITEAWQGCKVNVNYQKEQNKEDRSALYIDIRPCPFQFRGNDPKLMFKCKLPVIGQIFNNRNGRSQAVVDLIKPYQVMVNAFYNQAFQVAQKNNGKFFLMGASLLPSVKDWGGEEAMEKFMTICSNIGLGVIDDSLSNAASTASMQYGLKVLDMDESERISRLINLAMLVEQQGFLQLGITPQRQGQIQASETATGTNTAVANSYAVTEIYFEEYNQYRRRKLQMMLELAQFVASREEDVVLPYITSDGGNAFIATTGTDLLLKDLGVYVNNTGEMQRKKKLIEELILKNNQSLLPFSKLIEIIKSDNLADIQKGLEQAESDQQKQMQEQQAREQELQQQQIQAQAEEKDKDRAFKAEQAQLDRENKIVLEQLRGIANESSYSPTEDLTPTLIEQSNLALEKSKHEFEKSLALNELNNKQIESIQKNALEKKKLDGQLTIANKQNTLKEKEMANKLKVEKEKLKQIDVQNQSQEKLAMLKHKNDKELADKKLAIEKTKASKKKS
jgi:hypothetical protein